ncbi:MAG: hypothetical protein ACO307_10605 [Ilumatobacteraceae bacterium]|jgi:hypothetical protein
MSEFQKALSIVLPNGDDWLVTIVTRSRRFINRRISPGAMSEQEASDLAVRLSGLQRSEISDLSVRRVGSAKLELPASADPLSALIRRIGA